MEEQTNESILKKSSKKILKKESNKEILKKVTKKESSKAILKKKKKEVRLNENKNLLSNSSGGIFTGNISNIVHKLPLMPVQQDKNHLDINLASILRKWGLYEELFSFLNCK